MTPLQRWSRRATAGLLACALPALAQPALAQPALAQPGPPAGVAAYACQAGEALFLLALDPAPGRGAWGHLGGRAEPGEAPLQTALRELHEESNCSVAPTEAALARATGPSVAAGSRFHTFVVEVPHVPVGLIAQPRRCNDVEREQWVWVAHTDLMTALDAPGHPVVVREGSRASVPLWQPAWRSLRQARDEGVLPRQDPCRPGQ